MVAWHGIMGLLAQMLDHCLVASHFHAWCNKQCTTPTMNMNSSHGWWNRHGKPRVVGIMNEWPLAPFTPKPQDHHPYPHSLPNPSKGWHVFNQPAEQGFLLVSVDNTHHIYNCASTSVAPFHKWWHKQYVVACREWVGCWLELGIIQAS